MDVFPFPISDPRNPDGELGLYANPNLGAQLFLSGLTGPGTPAARTAGSVAAEESEWNSGVFVSEAQVEREVLCRFQVILEK